MLFPDGVYAFGGEPPAFCRLPATRPKALEQLIHTISKSRSNPSPVRDPPQDAVHY